MKRLLASLLATVAFMANASDPVHEYYMTLDDNLTGAPAELASAPINGYNERLALFFIKNIGSQLAYAIEMDADPKTPYASVKVNRRGFVDASDFLLDSFLFADRGHYKPEMPFAGYFGTLKAYNKASAFEKRRMNASIINSVKQDKEEGFFTSMVGKKVLIPIKDFGVFTFDFDTMSKSIKLDHKLCENTYEHEVSSEVERNNLGRDSITYSLNGLNTKIDNSGRCILTFDLSSDELLAEKVENAFSDGSANLFLITEMQNVATFGPRIAEATGVVVAKKVDVAKLEDDILKAVKGRRSVYYGFEYLTHVISATSVEKDLGAIVSRFPKVVSDKADGELDKAKTYIKSTKFQQGAIIGSQSDLGVKTVRLLSSGMMEVRSKINLSDDPTGYVAHYKLKEHGDFLYAELSKAYQNKMVAPRLLVLTSDSYEKVLSFIEIDELSTTRRGGSLNAFNLSADLDFITSMGNKIGFSEELMVDVIPIQAGDDVLASKSPPELGPLNKPVFTTAVLKGKMANKMSCNILNVEKKKGPPINQSGYYIISQKLPDDINVSTLMRNVSSVVMARYSGEDKKRISPAISSSEVMFRVDGYMDEGVKPPFVVRVKDGLLTASYEQKLDNQYEWKESSSKRDEGIFCDMINSL